VRPGARPVLAKRAALASGLAALLVAVTPGAPSRAAGDGDSGLAAVAVPRAAAVVAGAGGDAAAASAVEDAATAKRLAGLRRKVLKDEDFVENDDTNRDPFHSYLKLFAEKNAPKGRKQKAVFDKASLEELALIAIVTGDDTPPRAMFRDATGLGKTVGQGNYLSRVEARVAKILSDRVIVEITETVGNGGPRVVEKAILINPDEVVR
jgi:Tfp pilus assembly protein PilP